MRIVLLCQAPVFKQKFNLKLEIIYRRQRWYALSIFYSEDEARNHVEEQSISRASPRSLQKEDSDSVWNELQHFKTEYEKLRNEWSVIHLFLSSVTELTWLSKTFVHVLLVLFYVRLGIDTLAIARDVEICDIFTIMLQYFNDIHFLVFSLSVHHNLKRNCLYFLCTQNIKKSSNCMQTSMIFAYQWRSQRCLQRNLIKVFKEI